jgi:hypothetical protein
MINNARTGDFAYSLNSLIGAAVTAEGVASHQSRNLRPANEVGEIEVELNEKSRAFGHIFSVPE